MDTKIDVTCRKVDRINDLRKPIVKTSLVTFTDAVLRMKNFKTLSLILPSIFWSLF